MKHPEQIRVLKELLHYIDTDTVYDTGRVLINPTSSYVDAELANREWETFFQEHPQIIGLSPELPNVGSYITNHDLGMPILATRDKNGKFHAFVNSCRHRGAQLTNEPRGEKSRFVCPFHAWTYSLDGQLVGIRKGEEFGDVEKACHNLVELPSQEKYGLLVVHPHVDGSVDIDELLGTFAEEMASFEFDKCKFMGDATLDKALNWKLANDTFGEIYHFSTLHSESLNHLAYGDYASYREFGRHHRICTANRHLDVMRKKPESQWSFAFGSIAAYYLFPNINMVFAGGMVVLVRVYPHPSEVGRSISRISHFEMPHIKQQLSAATATKPGSLYEADHSAEVEWDLSATVELLLSTVENEDYWMAEQAQITANAGKVENFLFGRNEPALQHFHINYREVLGDPPLQEYNAG